MFVSVGATSVSNTLHLGSDTIADSATGGPLAQWLTAVALKVWYPLACRSMWPTNLTLSPCWEIDRGSKERGKEKDKNVIVRDDGFGRERGQVSGGFLNHFSPPLSSPPSISPMASKGEWQVSLLSFPSLLSCLRALWPGRGLTAQLLLLISQLRYCICSFFPLSPSIAFSRSVSICKSWGWLKYLQAHGRFNLENICDSLTSNNSLRNVFLLFFSKCHPLSLRMFVGDSIPVMLQKCMLSPINALLIVHF